ncbi:MAG: hypothetical protein ACXVAX_09055 [Pseudobdellovibrio sp.]
MLTKMLPLLVVGAGAYKNSDKIKLALNFFTVAGVQVEMSNICKVIKLDSIDGQIPSEDPEKFAAYVRANIKTQDGKPGRDFSKDMWNTPYKLEIKGRIATVVSAGPDKQFGTKDDVRASTDIY